MGFYSHEGDMINELQVEQQKIYSVVWSALVRDWHLECFREYYVSFNCRMTALGIECRLLLPPSNVHCAPCSQCKKTEESAHLSTESP